MRADVAVAFCRASNYVIAISTHFHIAILYFSGPYKIIPSSRAAALMLSARRLYSIS